MIGNLILPIFVVVVFVVVIIGIFTNKGRLFGAKPIFWGGEVVKDYGWLNSGDNVNPIMNQQIQLVKYKKGDEIFFVLIVKDSGMGFSTNYVKISEQLAEKLVSYFTQKNS